jgi:lipid A 3-O-deacylase
VSLACALGALFLLTALPSHAQVDGPSRITLTWDNDLLAGTDRHYTNGARVELSGRLDPHALPSWLAGDQAEWGLAVGQNIYTPEDLEAAEPAADDRPYAGLSYVALSVTRRLVALGLEDRIELSLGVVGQSSGAQAIHRLAHEVFGSEKARGWRHQLRDEPAVELTYRANLQLVRGQVGGLTGDVRPTLGVALGNVATFASLGAAAHFGVGVPGDCAERRMPIRLYLTASAEVRLVAHDIFLDGSWLHGGGHRVAKERVVAHLSLGFVLAIHDRVSLTYTHTFRTPAFEQQLDGDQFGSLSLGLSW